jgi:hypothetical protein
MIQDMKIRNYSPRTVTVYVDRVAKFAKYFDPSPDRLSTEHIREFQRYLVEEKHCSWSQLNQTVCALRFFYKVCLDQPALIDYIPYAKQPKKLPVVLSRAEVARVFQAAANLKHRTLLMTLYAIGVRISEALALQVCDSDSGRMMIHIRQGKAGRDRYVPLHPTLLKQLREYWRVRRPTLWLFPGRDPTRALVFALGRTGLPAGGATGRANQKGHSAYVPPYLCNPSPGGRHRPEDHPGVAGTQQFKNHLDLSARGRQILHERWPAQRPARRRDAPGASRRVLMSAHGVEVADILRGYGRHYLDTYPCGLAHARIIDDLMACRTAALGGHRRQCPECGHELIAYNSCRNRHCPKCQAAKQADWTAAQQANVLDVPYFHIVFTLPHQLSPLALQNKRVLYGLLFRCASGALLTVAANPAHLGARVGFTAILHTWGQTLMHHPHLHCLVPGGGLSPDGQRWIAAKNRFLLPVRVLSRLFRGRFIAGLQAAGNRGELTLCGRLAPLSHPQNWDALIGKLRQTEWVVYAKPAFGSPQQVLKYLARYTHRVAISNRRLIRLKDGQVTFRYKDYRSGHRQRLMRLEATEFIRRFLLHSLPKGFMRIRHYGLLANRVRKKRLAQCRRLLRHVDHPATQGDPTETPSHRDAGFACPKCKHTATIIIEIIPPARAGPSRLAILPG